MLADPVDVSIFCTAYNHERYIAQCIESIVEQTCDYNIELLINDDSSSDSTAEIIKTYAAKYPAIIRPFYQEVNLYSRHISIADTVFRPAARGTYIAICEGDDFWTDPCKLQKQISLLDSRSDLIACVHAGKYVREDGSDRGDLFKPFEANCEIEMEDAIAKWLVPTASIVYRASALKDGNPLSGIARCGDVPLLLYLLTQGKVYYFCDVMCAYRVNSVSSLSRRLRNGGIALQLERLDQFIKFFEFFDEYTKHSYSNAIDEKIASLQVEQYLYSGDRSYIKTEFAEQILRVMPLKTKLVNFLNRNSPWIVDLYERMK